VVEGITVVCLSKDRPDYFARLAASIPDRFPVVEKILIQNGTDQETVDIACEYGWTIITPGYNTSFSEGNNIGARGAIGSHLLLVNNDVIVDPDCIDALWKQRALPLLGCKIVTTKNQLIHAGCGFRHSDMMPVHIQAGIDPENVVKSLYCPWVTFACVLVRKDAWDSLGGLSTEYFYSFEDVDYCLRQVEAFGQYPLMVYDAKVTHNFGGTRDMNVLDPKNAKVFFEKWVRTKRLQDALGMLFQ
jgi:GT2 family glycosyltransferase